VPGGTPVLALDQLPLSASLPESSIPGSASRDGRFALSGWALASESAPPSLRGQWVAALPFASGDDRFLAADLALELEGRPVPFQPHGRPTDPAWRLHGDAIYLAWPGDAPPPTGTITHARLAARLQRLEPVRSGLAPTDFVHHHLTIAGDTREGLLLAAPSSLTWRVVVPVGATFEAATAAVTTGLGRSDGARLRLEVVDAVGVHQVAERAVPPGAGAFEPWTADLSAFGGREVELRLTLDPQGTSDWDLAFVAHPVVVGKRAGEPARRVVWIGLDTTRPDHLGLRGYERPTSPNLDAWSHKATVFDAAVAPAPRTRPSFRTALTGRRPLDAVGEPTILARLDQAGFATAGIVANVHLNQRFGFTRGADRWLLDTEARADAQVDRAISWLDDHADRDAALFLHFMDPHLLYDAPPPFRERFVTDPDPALPRRFTRSTVLSWQRGGQLDDRRKAHIEALHDGEIAFLDAELGRLFSHLDTLPGRTLVIVHSDHGEEFWEHGGFEHNHTLKPEVVDAVLMLRTPGQATGQRISTPVTLADLVPTVLDQLGMEPVTSDGISLAAASTTPLPARALDVGHLMYDSERWGVRVDGHTYVLHTGSGREELYDRAADPGEHTDLSASTDLTPYRSALAQAHGLDVGPGWRAQVRLQGAEVIWDLPVSARSAGVLDPESLRGRRANLVWGETAPVGPDDVATVTLSEDRRRLTLTPGSHGEGTVYVRFDTLVPPGGLIRSGGATGEVLGGPQQALPGLFGLDVREGTIVVPPVGEAARMRAANAELGGVDATTQGLLRELGYLEE
jgi:arylsulfatase A-like enzyme